MMDEEVEPKECFVVCAIGGDNSPQRTHADWVLEGIIRPLFAEHYSDFKVHRADHMNVPGLIDAQIIDKLLNASLVIADLTWLNPNAFYEIGIRHVVGKPIIHMNLATETIPFDNKMYLSLPFSVARPQDLTAAKDGLKKMVDAVLAPDYVTDNPVIRARGQAQFAQNATPADKVLVREMENISNRLAFMEGAFIASQKARKPQIRMNGNISIEPPEPPEILYFEPKGSFGTSGPKMLENFVDEVLRPMMLEGSKIEWQRSDMITYEFSRNLHPLHQIAALLSEANERGLAVTAF